MIQTEVKYLLIEDISKKVTNDHFTLFVSINIFRNTAHVCNRNFINTRSNNEHFLFNILNKSFMMTFDIKTLSLFYKTRVNTTM